MKRTVVIAVVLTAVICASAWSQVGGPPPGGPRGPGMPSPITAIMPPVGILQHGAQALGLTEDQIAKLRDSAQKADEIIRPLMKTLGESCKALRDALAAPDFDAQNIGKLAATAEKDEAAVVAARIAEWARIRAILTADQIAKLQELMAAPPPPLQWTSARWWWRSSPSASVAVELMTNRCAELGRRV